MPVLTVDKVPGWSAQSSLSDGELQTEPVEKYVVTTSGPGERAWIDILTNPRIPKLKDRHPVATRLFVVDVNPQERSDLAGVWDVDVSYSALSSKDQEPNPLARPADISVESVEEEEIVYFDNRGKPVANTAGDLLQGITEPVERLVISIKKNVPRTPVWLWSYANSTNAGSIRVDGRTFQDGQLRFRRARRGELKVETISPERVVPYYELTFELHFRAEGWKRKFANVGFQERVLPITPVPSVLTAGGVAGGAAGGGAATAGGAAAGAAGAAESPPQTKKRRILDGEGEPISEPAWLDKRGVAIREKDGQGNPTNQLKAILDPADIHVLEFDLKHRLPFSVLPLR